MLKILVKDIPAAGLHVHKKLEPKELGLTEEDLQCSVLDVESDLQRVGSTVLAKTRVKTKLAYVCARCLEPIEKVSIQKIDQDFSVNPTIEYIDLSDDIRQELILNYDPVVLCKADCKGLCAGCGVNLNTEKCECKK